MTDVDALLGVVTDHLAAGRFPDARKAADDALAAAPDDPRVRSVYADLYLAHAVRLAAVAREERRREVDERGRPGQAFEDGDAVKARFRESLAAFDRVLAVKPDHAKALALKAQILFRIDRGNRPEALATYDLAIAALEASVREGPAREAGRRNLLRDRRRIEGPCAACQDTGFCPDCGGSGWRSALGIRRKCEACLGHGTCKRCGVL